MFKWFRERRKDIKFAYCFEAEAENRFDEGEISYDTLEKCRLAAGQPEIMRDARNQLTTGDGLLGGIQDWNWEAIIKWFKEYFIPVMRVIIPIVIMFMDENPSEDE